MESTPREFIGTVVNGVVVLPNGESGCLRLAPNGRKAMVPLADARGTAF